MLVSSCGARKQIFLIFLSSAFEIIFYSYTSSLIAENWKGEQKTIAMKWGTTGFEDEETERNEFKGVHTPSPIDGSDTLFYSASNRFFVSMFINVSSFVVSWLVSYLTNMNRV